MTAKIVPVPVQTLDSACRLSEALVSSELSLRELGGALDVSPQTVMRWKTGDRPIPIDQREHLEAVLRDAAAAPTRVAAEVVSGPWTIRELENRLSGRVERLCLRAMLGDGRLTVSPIARRDGRGRYYERPGVFLARTSRAGLDRSAPRPPAGQELALARKRSGLPVAAAAERAGVSAGTWRGWEAAGPPRARVPEFIDSLDWLPTGPELRDARLAAGWSLKEVGRRVGVSLSVVHSWETGKRRPSRGRLMALASLLAAAQRAADDRRNTALAALIALAETGPITESEWLHRSRRRRDGRQYVPELAVWALQEALSRGLLVRVGVIRTSDSSHPVSALCTPDAVPQKPRGGLTGRQLGHERQRLGISRRVLAEQVGCSAGLVTRYEQSGDHRLHPHWSAPLRSALSELETKRSELGLEILRTVDEGPLSRQGFLERFGNSNAARSARIALLKTDLEWGPAWDRLGRRVPRGALYRRGNAPTESARMAGQQLRKAREGAGWTTPELAKALGTRGNTVSRWETGARGLAPARAAMALSVLEGPAPARPADTRRLDRLLALTARPGGARSTELIPFRRSPVGAQSFDRALDSGLIWSVSRLETVKDGRVFARRAFVSESTPPSTDDDQRPSLTGSEIRARRLSAGLSQARLGELVGVRNVTVSGWERGTRGVPDRLVPAMYRALAIDA